MFWISTGVMIFIVGMFLYICLFSYILKGGMDKGGHIYLLLATVLSVIEYSLFTIGFYVRKNAG